MSFVLGFYGFKLEVTNPERDVFLTTRIKIPRHPEEPLAHLYARVLGYSHSYQDRLAFTEGFFAPKDPSLWVKDVTGEITSIIEIGDTDPERVHKYLRRKPPPKLVIYFYSEEHIARFCHGMRGSTSNWIEDVEFYLIDPNLLTSLTEHEKSSTEWQVNFSDDTLYLTVDGKLFESTIERLDMWAKFQTSLQP